MTCKSKTFLACLALWALPLSAAAQTGKAQALLQQGTELFQKRSFHEALRVLEQASKAARVPVVQGRIEIYIGMCYSNLGRAVPARWAFRAALHHDPTLELPDTPHAAPARNNFNRVRRGLKGTLSVTADRSGSLVLLDGKQLGLVPLVAPVPIGRHKLEVRTADGSMHHACQLVITPGAETRINANLRPVQGLLSVRTQESRVRVYVDDVIIGATPLERLSVRAGKRRVRLQKAGFVEQSHELEIVPDRVAVLETRLQPTAGAAAPSTQPRGRGRYTDRIWTWVAAGGAAATGIAAIGLGISVKVDAGKHDDIPPTDHARLDELEQGMRDKALAANILLGIAGGLAITTAVLFFVEDRWINRDRARPTGAAAALRRTRLLVGPGPGLGLSTSF